MDVHGRREIMQRRLGFGLLGLALLLGGCAGVSPGSRSLVTEEFMIPGPDPGVHLYVRNKRPGDLATFNASNVVLFVHGATFPSETSFDLPLDGLSWMDYVASQGYDVYLVDLRGYGKSSRPPGMDQPAEQNPPIVRTETAVRDFGAAVDFVLKRRGIPKLNVIGWSWGTSIVARYTSENNEKVNRLVLHAPQWVRKGKPRPGSDKPLGAYRIVTITTGMKGRFAGIPPGKTAISQASAEEWARATFASDPVGAKGNPRFVRAPNGVVLDGREYWGRGKPLYDPAGIRVPTLVILGEWDASTPVYMAQALYPQLVNAEPKRLVIVDEGTHGLMFEKNRMRLFEEVQRFLGESAPRP
jgi:pimeloyl-ACP methyl ester carboxylesterase